MIENSIKYGKQNGETSAGIYEVDNKTIFTEITDNGTGCLLYTSDAADERSSVDLGGRRIIKKKKKQKYTE